MSIAKFENIAPRASKRVGKVRKGAAKDPNANQPGTELDYFRFVPEPGYEHLTKLWEAAYGKEAHEIIVAFVTPLAHESMKYFCEFWGGGTLKHRCNGEFMYRWLVNTQNGPAYMDDPELKTKTPCRKSEHRKSNPDKDKVARLDVIPVIRTPDGRLHSVFPAEGETPTTVTVLSGGAFDIVEFVAQFGTKDRPVKTQIINPETGSIQFIPFRLTRVLTPYTYADDNGERRKGKKWMIKVTVDAQFSMERHALALWASGGADAVLPAGASYNAPALPAQVSPGRSAPKPAAKATPAVQPPSPDDMIEGEYVEAPKAADEMGKKLWPGGKWGEVRGKLVKDPAIRDEADMVRFTTKRAAEIADRAKLSDHIAKGWPINGSGDWAVEVLQEFNVSVDTLGLNPDPLNVIAGAVAAWNRKQQEGGDKLSASDLANIVFANACPDE